MRIYRKKILEKANAQKIEVIKDGYKVDGEVGLLHCKLSGMSWSKIGSLVLAALTMVKINGESQVWLEKRKLLFKIIV